MTPTNCAKGGFFLLFEQVWDGGGEKQEPCGCGQNSSETSAFWTAGFSCNYRHFDDGFMVPM